LPEIRMRARFNGSLVALKCPEQAPPPHFQEGR
jgi:hypothetical protein